MQNKFSFNIVSIKYIVCAYLLVFAVILSRLFQTLVFRLYCSGFIKQNFDTYHLGCQSRYTFLAEKGEFDTEQFKRTLGSITMARTVSEIEPKRTLEQTDAKHNYHVTLECSNPTKGGWVVPFFPVSLGFSPSPPAIDHFESQRTDMQTQATKPLIIERKTPLKNTESGSETGDICYYTELKRLHKNGSK